jgi:hypothetical protein
MAFCGAVKKVRSSKQIEELIQRQAGPIQDIPKRSSRDRAVCGYNHLCIGFITHHDDVAAALAMDAKPCPAQRRDNLPVG